MEAFNPSWQLWTYLPCIVAFFVAIAGIWISKETWLRRVILTVFAVMAGVSGLMVLVNGKWTADQQRIRADESERRLKAVFAQVGGAEYVGDYRKSEAEFHKYMAQKTSPDFIGNVDKAVSLAVPMKLRALRDDPLLADRFELKWVSYKEYLIAQLNERRNRLLEAGYLKETTKIVPAGERSSYVGPKRPMPPERKFLNYHFRDGIELRIGNNKGHVKEGEYINFYVYAHAGDRRLEFLIDESGAHIPGAGSFKDPLNDSEALKNIESCMDAFFSETVALCEVRAAERQEQMAVRDARRAEYEKKKAQEAGASQTEEKLKVPVQPMQGLR